MVSFTILVCLLCNIVEVVSYDTILEILIDKMELQDFLKKRKKLIEKRKYENTYIM